MISLLPRGVRIALVGLLTLAGPLILSCAPPAAESAPEVIPGLELSDRDLTVRPGDDFFAYANGGWSARTEIPADRSSTGAFREIFDRTEERLAHLIEETLDAPGGSPARKIGDYYSTFLDEAAIDAEGIEPVSDLRRAIEAIADRRELSSYLGRTLRADVDAFNATDLSTPNLFGLWVSQDLDDPSRYVPFLLQGGLDMPDRAYYLDESESMEAARAACLAHMAAMLELAGIEDADGRAARVFELERRIAEAHWSRAESGDMTKGNTHWSPAAFDELAPGIDWSAFFTAAGLADEPTFVVWQHSATSGIAALVADQDLDTWKDYLLFHLLDHFAETLPKAFRDERFDFHGRTLSGTPEQPSRHKRAIAATSAALGDAVGKLYVEKHFPPSAKARVEAMVENIRQAFDRRIEGLEWMDERTKVQAREKLARLQVSVGYPDDWRDETGLEVIPGDALGNLLRTELFDLKIALDRLDRPASRSDWVMTPQTVNAVNLPVMNAMNFPAAILEPPFFDPERPVAMDYGAIGAVIGHEISHSFDDQGAKFDATGRLSNWWTDADLAQFEQLGARLVAQYDAYRPFPDLAVDGRLTLSENIADLAGIAASFDAYRLSLGGEPAPTLAGLSGDQQFFLAFAQSWRAKYREPALRRRLVGDGHAPAPYRVATVRNLDAWYEAFSVGPDGALSLDPAARVRIW